MSIHNDSYIRNTESKSLFVLSILSAKVPRVAKVAKVEKVTNLKFQVPIII